FMNPCLSGWDRGEEKHRYMHLCHQVLSRAKLNSLSKLKESGIITSNLVVLPTTSNISLANNGVHLSLGSRMLSQILKDESPAFNLAHEKYIGDLVIKFVEHFLPLFVGTYSAAPYRLAFHDFHPEKVLAFLPYELDFTHLRMTWRRWKKKARVKVLPFGSRLTPFGPQWLDKTIGRLLHLKGDFISDFRLLDYLVAVMSTEESPALDGRLGNHQRLKADLSQMGLYDQQMPLYLLYRQREFQQSGFSGFEGRHYSLFEDIQDDLASAVELQSLITALAFKLIATGSLNHEDIPDKPEIESERRQIFFGAAIGLPTFFVKSETTNRLLKEILTLTDGIRPSGRYSGYHRVPVPNYLKALMLFLRREGRDLIENHGYEQIMRDLSQRLEEPARFTAQGRLCQGILHSLGVSSSFEVEAGEFNRAAENYYRQVLRRKHTAAAWDVFESDLETSSFKQRLESPLFKEAANYALNGHEAFSTVKALKNNILSENSSLAELTQAINLLLMDIKHQALRSEEDLKIPPASYEECAPGPVHTTISQRRK
ncbi:MAG: hypothetical protein HQK55_16385, partial [Deltaproteobacteria bacterium]|nr:hypothetical protein [Deltaproteobacteria bacterium]